MDHNKHTSYRRERGNSNPSFSSTLLDAIYRSIDETVVTDQDKELVLYKETMRKKQHSSNLSKADHQHGFQDEIDMANLQRACLIEKWMEKKVVVRRNSGPDHFGMNKSSRNDFFNSSSSGNSSDSSCGSGTGGGFSSSEAESVYGVSSYNRSSCYGLQKPKPIRTSIITHQPAETKFNSHDGQKPKAKKEGGGGFVKTKSRALKIYTDLKKVKQPISPGGRLASFLNSIFTPANAKKTKISSSSNIASNVSSSTCSSAASFSRSCLSKSTAPSSRGKSSINNGMKRSVRFYPESVIVDEDCQPRGQKSLYDDDKPISMDFDKVENNTPIKSSLHEELKFHAMEKNRRVEEAARDLFRNFQKKVVDQCDQFDEEEEEDDGDDAASYASSDLFELDNLSAIGMERYREELPVYETTHLGTNRAIANGLIL
ncbi:hypothetical protein ACH5RR_024354 [Cinchona calisaya]|uniref:Protein BIG GRAIN 1-like B n=1 Tax=Cinchona calisaya TaxID=153742 RepID=A0ABD2Z0L4_9GENT